MSKHIVVIGGGPGGYVAAIRGAQLGAKVTLIEKSKLGGTCLNWGCIPTKTLLRTAEVLHLIKNSAEFGIESEFCRINVQTIQNRKNSIIHKLVTGIEQLVKGNGIELIQGTASFTSNKTIEVHTATGEIQTYSPDNIIVATGSCPAIPPISGSNLPGILSSDDILQFNSIPESLAIVGGGIIGMEFAALFSGLGSKVTVIEFLPQILNRVDTDLVKRFVPMAKKRGINIITSSKVSEISKDNDSFVLKVESPKGELEISSQTVLIATGRKPYVDGLCLDKSGVEFNGRFIPVNTNYMTNQPGIYAIGDVNGESMLAHAASHQGLVAIEHIFGHSSNQEMIVPSCIFTFPEISYAGITEDEAKEKGLSYKTSKFLFGANGKALALGEGEGMVKVISCSETKKILGIHIMGPHASDLIHEGVLAISKGMTVEDIAYVVHAHPTLSEAFHEAILGLDNMAIHSINK